MTASDGSFITSKLETPRGGLVMVTQERSEPSEWLRERLPDARVPEDRGWPRLGCTLSVAVPDVDAHFTHASAENAVIIAPPSDQPWGLRVYSALDLVGHSWEFVAVIGTPEPEDWGAKKIQ